MKSTLLLSFLFLVIAYGCNRQPAAATATAKESMVLRFQVDTAGTITDSVIKQQLIDLAVRISKNADRIMLHSYTEKMNNPELEKEIATQQVRAAKEAMAQAPVPRVFYNVGIDVHGSLNPVDSLHPSDRINRRIEVEFL